MEKGRENMIPFNSILCDSCEHFEESRLDGNVYRQYCAAFPDGIPDEIYFDGADHTKPWKGDHGIRYVKKPGKDT
mgnify:CR=1 FL=1